MNSIKFENLNLGNTQAANANTLKLYKRTSNEDINPWGTSLDESDAAIAGATNGTVTFNTGNSITSFSQFLIQEEECPTHLYVNVNPIDGDTIRASVLISSNGKEVSGDDIVFLAGNCVQLESGFEVANGAEFLANIENCIATTNITINDSEAKKNDEVEALNIKVDNSTNEKSVLLKYDLPQQGKVSIALQSLDGKQLLRPLNNHLQKEGKQQIALLNEQLKSGLYYVIVELDRKVIARKIITL